MWEKRKLSGTIFEELNQSWFLSNLVNPERFPTPLFLKHPVSASFFRQVSSKVTGFGSQIKPLLPATARLSRQSLLKRCCGQDLRSLPLYCSLHQQASTSPSHGVWIPKTLTRRQSNCLIFTWQALSSYQDSLHRHFAAHHGESTHPSWKNYKP